MRGSAVPCQFELASWVQSANLIVSNAAASQQLSATSVPINCGPVCCLILATGGERMLCVLLVVRCAVQQGGTVELCDLRKSRGNFGLPDTSSPTHQKYQRALRSEPISDLVSVRLSSSFHISDIAQPASSTCSSKTQLDLVPLREAHIG